MAKLTISEAARVAGVARSTLHRAIQKGRMSLDPDGRLDTAELLRCGYTLQGVAPQERNISLQRATPQAPVAQRVLISASDLALQALQRERDLLQQQLDATRDLLQSERAAALERERIAQERERATQEREAFLLQMLQAAQQRVDRLLEAPRTSVPAPAVPPIPPLQAAGAVQPVTSLEAIPEPWQRIIDYVRSVNRAVTPAEVQQALRLAHTPRHMLNRMVQRGVVRRLTPGVYGLEG
jgi:hypothetical protein